MDDRDIRLARKVTGVAAPTRSNVALSGAIAAATSEVEKLAASGAPAKDMAVALRHVAMLTLLDALAGEDKRLAADAAKEILARSDGRAGGEVNVQVNNNVLNVSVDDLARRLAFLDRLRAPRGSLVDITVGDDDGG